MRPILRIVQYFFCTCRAAAAVRVPALAPVLVLALALSGCAAGRVDTPVFTTRDNAVETWQRFLNFSENAEAMTGPFLISANLHYAGDEGSQRLSAYFWGNGGAGNAWPLRLDIMGGMHNIMAAIREDGRYFTAHIPGDNAVYVAPQGTGSLEAFGVPVPFSLADLSLLLTGRFDRFFLNGSPGVPPASPVPTGFLFELPAEGHVRFPGTLIISPVGLPLAWSEAGGTGWNLDIEYPADSTRPLPRRLVFRHHDGKKATVVIRSLERVEKFSDTRLELEIPAGTEMRLIQPR